jgi:hypothetical protein
MQAIIDFVSGKGWYFARCDDDSCIFVPQRAVEKRRYLKVADRIEFDVIPSTKQDGQFEAANVKYLGHVIASQRSAPPYASGEPSNE